MSNFKKQFGIKRTDGSALSNPKRIIASEDVVKEFNAVDSVTRGEIYKRGLEAENNKKLGATK